MSNPTIPVRRNEQCAKCQRTDATFFAKHPNGAWYVCADPVCGHRFVRKHPKPLLRPLTVPVFGVPFYREAAVRPLVGA